MRWDKADIPHKGWQYVGMEDLGEDVYPGDPIPYEQCEMCGKEKIRYVHLLKHPDYDGEIRVGCDCASKMLCDYVTPQDRERNLKNRVNRRKNFMKQEWYMLRPRWDHRWQRTGWCGNSRRFPEADRRWASRRGCLR